MDGRRKKARFRPVFFAFNSRIYYWFARMAHITPLFVMHWRHNLNIRFSTFSRVVHSWCLYFASTLATHYHRFEQPNQMFHSISLPFSSQFDADMSFVVAVMFHSNMHVAPTRMYLPCADIESVRAEYCTRIHWYGSSMLTNYFRIVILLR